MEKDCLMKIEPRMPDEYTMKKIQEIEEIMREKNHARFQLICIEGLTEVEVEFLYFIRCINKGMDIEGAEEATKEFLKESSDLQALSFSVCFV